MRFLLEFKRAGGEPDETQQVQLGIAIETFMARLKKQYVIEGTSLRLAESQRLIESDEQPKAMES